MSEAQAMKDACAAAAETGPQHDTLARFAGNWRAEVKIWMEPGKDPIVTHGTMRSEMVLGGRFLQQQYRDENGTMEGRGFWGYNTIDGRYEGFWIDSMATMFQVEQGQHDAESDTYEMIGTMTDPGSRRMMKKRSLITYAGPKAHRMEMFFDRGEGGEQKCMEIRYTRA